VADKLQAFLRVVAHTVFSFIAALLAGGTLYAFLLPILGRERYYRVAQLPVMVVLLLSFVALGGAQVYHRWPDRRAFLAWVLPALWLCHLILSRGMAAMEGKWSDPLFWVGIGVSYSCGALIAAVVANKTLQKPPRSESPMGQ
jgi:peptidoglycan biosynthesis protein MviN/MurJ (putative lipid II flippase)